MTTSNRQIAEAFSRHQFTETLARLAPDVRWVTPGQATLEGRDAVLRACRESGAELAGVTMEFERFVSVADAQAAAVDAIGRYVDADGQTSIVSSCDIYEFDADGALTMITTYAVELPESPVAG